MTQQTLGQLLVAVGSLAWGAALLGLWLTGWLAIHCRQQLYAAAALVASAALLVGVTTAFILIPGRDL